MGKWSFNGSLMMVEWKIERQTLENRRKMMVELWFFVGFDGIYPLGNKDGKMDHGNR